MFDVPSIPGYRLDRELGQRGMARVYLAHEAKLDRPVALKVMMLSPTQDRTLSERFVKEARTAARLVHSNIVSIYDVGESGLGYYMAMEFLEGGSLRQRLQHRPLDPAEALSIARERDFLSAKESRMPAEVLARIEQEKRDKQRDAADRQRAQPNDARDRRLVIALACVLALLLLALLTGILFRRRRT